MTERRARRIAAGKRKAMNNQFIVVSHVIGTPELKFQSVHESLDEAQAAALAFIDRSERLNRSTTVPMLPVDYLVIEMPVVYAARFRPAEGGPGEARI